MRKYTLFLMGQIALFANLAFAQTTEWKLVWDMNNEPDMKEYIVYRYTAGNPANPIATVPHNADTENSMRNLAEATITYFDRNLEAGKQYFYRIQAVDSSDLRSDFSSTVSDYIPKFAEGSHTIMLRSDASEYNFNLSEFLEFPQNTDSLEWYILDDNQMVEVIQAGGISMDLDKISGNAQMTISNSDEAEISFAVLNDRGFYDTCTIFFSFDFVPDIEIYRGDPQMPIVAMAPIEIHDSKYISDSTWFQIVQDEDDDPAELDYQILSSETVEANRTGERGYTLTVQNTFDFDTLTFIVSDEFFSDTAGIVVKMIPLTTLDDEFAVKPLNFYLRQNSPNPFNPETLIKYGVPKSGRVRIEVSNILGQKVATLLDTYKDAGNYSIKFDAIELPSGSYFYTIISRDFIQTKKMIVLK